MMKLITQLAIILTAIEPYLVWLWESLGWLWAQPFFQVGLLFLGIYLIPGVRKKINLLNDILNDWKKFKKSWNRRFKRLRKNLKKVQNEVNLLKPQQTTGGTSPISITDLGKEISEKIGLKEMTQKYQSHLPEIEKKASAYEIQEKCFDFAEKHLFTKLEDSEKKAIEEEAYNRGLKKEAILRILGVYFRDKILNQRNYV